MKYLVNTPAELASARVLICNTSDGIEYGPDMLKMYDTVKSAKSDDINLKSTFDAAELLTGYRANTRNIFFGHVTPFVPFGDLVAVNVIPG